ncbi:hypothetical protein BDA99DRAFT_539509 [Phascolomyces articulosus]|uniref:Ricin B lectin domain-containing protein n=1 Tax=Phascolomyces articulosus TaxID=60185 RepID=A0AAD5PBX4_9FUNG|nr:hypothetical protein BDA99DRAFT_539509 [Phascolomyces articulosus]
MVSTLQTPPHNNNNNGWMYIRNVSTGNVITALTSNKEDALRSQVIVSPPKQTDQELWRWDGQFLRNKSNDLVLDIRKGRLRLIQETEICLYTPKPESEAHNQLWGVRDGAFDVYGRPQPDHSLIYSLSNDDWVLDIQHVSNPTDEVGNKLILFPYQTMDNETQQWIFIDESTSHLLNEPTCAITSTTMFKSSSTSSIISSNNNSIHPPTPATSASSSPVTSTAHDLSSSAELFAHGLSPAKRGSQSSVTLLSIEAYRECHQMVYLEKNPRLSDKAIAMAAAYETWSKWNQERVSSLDQPDRLQFHEVDKIRACLQSTAQSEASRIFDQCDQLSNHKETALGLANRLVIQLYEQVLMTP